MRFAFQGREKKKKKKGEKSFDPIAIARERGGDHGRLKKGKGRGS